MKKTGVLVFLIFFLALAAQAEDGTQDEYSSDARDTLPVYNETYDIELNNHNEFLNAKENFKFDNSIQESLYDQDGNLVGVQVTDEEGNVLVLGRGLLDQDEDGNPVYRVPTGDGEEVITLGEQKGYEESGICVLMYYLAEKSTGGRQPRSTGGAEPSGDGDNEGKRENPPIVIIIPDTGDGDDPIEKVAKDPSRLKPLIDDIRDALANAGTAGQGAYEQYLENSSTYYEKAYQAIFSNLKKLKEDGIVAGDGFEKIKYTNASSQKARAVIDKIVEAIETEAQPGEVPDGSVDEIAEQLYAYKAEYLLPAVELYDRRIEESLKYIQDVIDGVIASRVALYFNIEKEKIDVLINLPKLDIKKKSE